jgi:hypothetical protein
VPDDTADLLYEEIRRSATDVDEIALHTGLNRRNIAKIKAHLFIDEHLLDLYEDLGVPAVWARFDSDLKIAEAWNRLRVGGHGVLEMRLLRHEAAELCYIRMHGPSYRAAHEAAQQRYPSPHELWDLS